MSIANVLVDAVNFFFSTYVNSFLTYFDVKLGDLSNVAFNMQDYLTSNIGLNFNSLFKAVNYFGLYLIVLKFLMKGFNIYVLWNEGDSDMDPFILFTGFFKAIIIAICFNVIYDFAIDIPIDFMARVMSSINTYDTEASTISGTVNAIARTYPMLGAIKVIFFIIYIVLWIQFIKRGLEIFILRAGISIACCGMMDSDGGVFKVYIKKLFQEVFSVLLQVILLKLGLTLLLNGNLLFGLAALWTCLKAPQFLQDFIMAYGGGQGVVSKATQSMYAVNMVRSFVK
jgi:hypothetical protein